MTAHENGNLSLSYQYQSIITGSGESRSISSFNNVFLNFGQQFSWGGFFSLSLNYYFSRDLKQISSYYLELQDVPLGDARLEASYGYTSFPLSGLARYGSFNSSTHLGLKGGRVALRTGNSDIYLFGGRLYGGWTFGDTDSSVLGIFSSFRLNRRWSVGLSWMKLSDIRSAEAPFESRDYHVVGMESSYQLAEGLHLLADARLALGNDGNRSDYLVKVGPYWQGKRASAEFYYTRATPGFPYIGGGLAWNREGFTCMGSYRPFEILSVFAGIDTFNENLARLLNRPVTDYTTYRSGINISIRDLPQLSVSYNRSSRNSYRLQQDVGDSSFGMVLLSLAQQYRRIYWSVYFNGGKYEDRIEPSRDYLFRRYAFQVRRSFFSRAYLYLNGYYDYRKEIDSGFVDKNSNAQVGANLGLASQLSLDLQFTYSLNRQENTGYDTSNIGGGGGLVYFVRSLKMDVALRYLYSRISFDSDVTYGRFYHQIFLNINKTVNWGGARGGGILGGLLKKKSKVVGKVFVDENLNGVRDPDEELLEGIDVLMDRRKAARTNSQGEYRVSSIDPGKHYLSLDMRNIPAFYEPADDRTEVVLEKGATIEAHLPVVPLGQLSGELYLDANENEERDDGDELLPDVLIVLYKDGEAIRSVVSNSAGMFTFDNVRPGLYSIVVDEVDIQRVYTHTGHSILEVAVEPWEEKRGLVLLVKKYQKPRKKKILDDY